MTTLCATPYDISAPFFYFESIEEYNEKATNLRNDYGQPVEEFELQFIDGESIDAELFEAAGINQANLEKWDDLEALDDDDKVKLVYLLDSVGYELNDALDTLDDVMIFEGNLRDAAEELFDECYAHDIPENLRHYIDYEAFARDLDMNGDMSEFEVAGTTYTCTNANGI
jgi:Antirestriction protein (ArdA)